MKTMNVTEAFNQQLAQRRANIINMFKNPGDFMDDSEVKKANNEEFDEEVDDKETKKGCGDGDFIKKEKEGDNTEDEYDEDVEDDVKKAEILNIIGFDTLDEWSKRVKYIDSLEDYVIKSEAANEFNKEINEFAKASEITKSDIMYALNACDSDIKFKKTGKELKSHIQTVVLPQLNSELATCKVKADNLLAVCGQIPTEDVPVYMTGDVHIDVGYKFYDWDETVYTGNDKISITGTLSTYTDMPANSCKNPATSVEEAESRRCYNEQIRKIANIVTDIKTCEILNDNVKDNESFNLSIRQLAALKFI